MKDKGGLRGGGRKSSKVDLNGKRGRGVVYMKNLVKLIQEIKQKVRLGLMGGQVSLIVRKK